MKQGKEWELVVEEEEWKWKNSGREEEKWVKELNVKKGMNKKRYEKEVDWETITIVKR